MRRVRGAAVRRNDSASPPRNVDADDRDLPAAGDRADPQQPEVSAVAMARADGAPEVVLNATTAAAGPGFSTAGRAIRVQNILVTVGRPERVCQLAQCWRRDGGAGVGSWHEDVNTTGSDVAPMLAGKTCS